MREVKKKQFQLGQTPISQIRFDSQSRDDIPPLLMGLQHIYLTPEVRKRVFHILNTMIPKRIDKNNGRPGMEMWKILVLGTLRLNMNWDYDRLAEMANQHTSIRQMLGHGGFDQAYRYKLQTLKDNVALFTPEILDKINQVVVNAGHALVKKKESPLRGRCDSFVVETNVHFPTDINLLFDAVEKAVNLVGGLCAKYNQPGWRQSGYLLSQLKRFYRKVQKARHSTSKSEDKQKKQKKRVLKAHRVYLDRADSLVKKVVESLEALRRQGVPEEERSDLERFIAHAGRQVDQIQRRVFKEETISHKEKAFSVFQEHTEWICKGKAGVPVELGLRVCVLEDQYRFILHHQVMQKQTDDQVAQSIVAEAQKRFPALKVCSFDKGFHSPSNQESLRELLDLLVLPKKGRLSQKDKEREYSPEFVKLRRQHSAVESAINTLEVHGLDRCPDHGIDGFERYVALAVLGGNIKRLGSIIRKREISSQKRRARLKKAA